MATDTGFFRSVRHCAPRRRGAVIVLTAVLLVVLMAMIAFSVDVGYMYLVKGELQRSVDSAALAGAGALVEGQEVAAAQVAEYLVRNPVGSPLVSIEDDELDAAVSSFLAEHQEDLDVQYGHWEADMVDPATGALGLFVPDNNLPSTIAVSLAYNNMPLFFGAFVDQEQFSVNAEAVAMYQPRDIVVVLDLSGSMNDDSELKSRNKLPQADIEANLLQIYQEIGSPTFGNMQWTPQYISSSTKSTVIYQLGLNNVPYPYPSGSWYDYVGYVMSSSNINNAGYRKKYGYLTLVNYWLEKKPRNDQTPSLWQASAQPATAVKDAVDVFMDYIQEVDTDDRVGLSIYNASNGNGKLESPLTDNFAHVASLSRARQAGHYHNYTNIGAGMETARHELEQNARTGAFKMIVLMTDGNANWVNGNYNTSGAVQYVLDEADEAAEHRWPIVTISLGAGADTSLMQQVADITNGHHFNVPGGQSVADYAEDLKEVFRQIADKRPLKIVK